MDTTAPSKWIEICLVALDGDREAAKKMAELLWRRHGVPGANIYIKDGEVVVSHPGGIVGLESGWDRI